MRLASLTIDYLTYKRALGHRLQSDEAILRSFCRSMRGIALADIDPPRVRAFLHRGRICQETIARKHRALGGLYRYIQGRHGPVLPSLPKLARRQESNFVPYIYSRTELRKLLQATVVICARPKMGLDAPTMRTALLVLYGAGLRLGELIALNDGDVDLKRGLLTIRETKFYKSRLVPLTTELIPILLAYRKRAVSEQTDRPFFCRRSGERITAHIVERTFRMACALAGVTRDAKARHQPRLHDLRHTAAVHRLIHWYRSGADLQYLLPRLATYLGHKSLVSTQRYLTLTPELLREASSRFERYVRENSHE